MKEMIYQREILGTSEILVKDEYKGLTYVVISRGAFPCCYVDCEDLDYYPEDIRCHGGITFEGTLDFGDGEKYYIGWDYAHCGDCTGWSPESGRKYNTIEMVDECKKVIDQLVKIKERI